MRALAREVAFKKIYSSLFISKEENDIDNFFEFDNLIEEQDKEFANMLVKLYVENKQQVDDLINGFLVDFSPERIFRIDRAIISLATVELVYYKETPTAIVINEAVKLAKKFGSEKSYSFVNGILKSISKGV